MLEESPEVKEVLEVLFDVAITLGILDTATFAPAKAPDVAPVAVVPVILKV